MRLAEDKTDWVVGFEDECWWSRVVQPTLHTFSEDLGDPLRLVEQSLAKDDLKSRRPSPATGCVDARAQRGVVALCGWPSSERDNHALFAVVLPEARRARQEGAAPDL